MFKAVILTYIITTLIMIIVFMEVETRRINDNKKRVERENEKLKSQIRKHNLEDQKRKERQAYILGRYSRVSISNKTKEVSKNE